MERLTKKMMDERLKQMRKLTGLNLGFSYFNGYTHLYNMENGENIITGTSRECFDAMYFYMLGYRNCLDRSEYWYNLKYNNTFRFYIKAIKPNFNTTRLLVKKVWMENETAIIYLVNPQRLEKENLRIETYDFENSSLFYNLANSGFREFIIVDNFGNPLYKFNARG